MSSSITDLCERLVTGVGKAAENAFYGQILGLLLKAVIEQQEGIDRKLQKLLEGPYKAGRILLEQARGEQGPEAKNPLELAAPAKADCVRRIETGGLYPPVD